MASLLGTKSAFTVRKKSGKNLLGHICIRITALHLRIKSACASCVLKYCGPVVEKHLNTLAVGNKSFFLIKSLN